MCYLVRYLVLSDLELLILYPHVLGLQDTPSHSNQLRNFFIDVFMSCPFFMGAMSWDSSAGLKFMILLPQLFKCWDYMCVPLHMPSICSLLGQVFLSVFSTGVPSSSWLWVEHLCALSSTTQQAFVGVFSIRTLVASLRKSIQNLIS